MRESRIIMIAMLLVVGSSGQATARDNTIEPPDGIEAAATRVFMVADLGLDSFFGTGALAVITASVFVFEDWGSADAAMDPLLDQLEINPFLLFDKNGGGGYGEVNYFPFSGPRLGDAAVYFRLRIEPLNPDNDPLTSIGKSHVSQAVVRTHDVIYVYQALAFGPLPQGADEITALAQAHQASNWEHQETRRLVESSENEWGLLPTLADMPDGFMTIQDLDDPFGWALDDTPPHLDAPSDDAF